MIVTKRSFSEKRTTSVVTQSAPTIPTAIFAVDQERGDVVRVTWTGGGVFYNVYYRLTSGGPFILANATPLASGTTQYDVGGLEFGTDYTFIVRGVNGLGTESANSNEVV